VLGVRSCGQRRCRREDPRHPKRLTLGPLAGVKIFLGRAQQKLLHGRFQLWRAGHAPLSPQANDTSAVTFPQRDEVRRKFLTLQYPPPAHLSSSVNHQGFESKSELLKSTYRAFDWVPHEWQSDKCAGGGTVQRRRTLNIGLGGHGFFSWEAGILFVLERSADCS
jgi:hypothetical protein